MKKKIKTADVGLAFLIESELDKTDIVSAAKAIPSKLLDMQETLAKIGSVDLIPLRDQVKTNFGPQMAKSFNDVVTTEVKKVLDAMQFAKDVIDAQIDNMTRVISGGPANDMALDSIPSDDESGSEPDINAPVSQDTDATGTSEPSASFDDDEGNADVDDELPPVVRNSPAGRPRKESTSRRLSPAVRALRESNNPDALVLTTFREVLTSGRPVSECVRLTARRFEIDTSDVVAIIREAKNKKDAKSKKTLGAFGKQMKDSENGRKRMDTKKPVREFDMRPTPKSKRGMFDEKTQNELRRELASVKKQMASHKENGTNVPHSLRSKFSELTFALRAKHQWGNVAEGTENKREAANRAGVEKWTRETLRDAGINAKVVDGKVTVKTAADASRARKALERNASLETKLPVVVNEAVPQKPLSPADMRTQEYSQQPAPADPVPNDVQATNLPQPSNGTLPVRTQANSVQVPSQSRLPTQQTQQVVGQNTNPSQTQTKQVAGGQNPPNTLSAPVPTPNTQSSQQQGQPVTGLGNRPQQAKNVRTPVRGAAV